MSSTAENSGKGALVLPHNDWNQYEKYYSESELFVLLRRLVEASGAKVSVLVLWNSTDESAQFHTYSYGLEGYSGERFSTLLTQAAQKVQRSPWDSFGGDHLQRGHRLQRSLEGEAARLGMGRSYALIMPVMLGGEAVGLFVLIHSQDLPAFMHRYPQMYNLVLDRLEVSVRHANLLYSLMRERSWFDTMLNHSKDGVAIVDRESKIIGINPALEELSGWKVGEAVGQPVYKILPISSIDAGSGTYTPNKGGYGLALYNQPSPIHLAISAEPVEAVLTDRNNQKIDVEVIGLTVRDAAGIPNGWVMTLRDIRKRKETERLGKVFLSAMSHELQTPIAVIKGFAGLMSDPEITMDQDIIRQKSKVILEESERLQKMVRQMLEAASIQAGGISLSCDMVDLESMVDRTLRRLGAIAEAKNIKVRKKIVGSVPAVWGDISRLEQVMTNLVENAIKYSTKGEVVVELKKQPSGVVVSVVDEGPGVSDEEARRIFGLFERGQEMKKKVRGSGLGLFISKAIIDAHGGCIGVTHGAGGGSCFYFSIPCREAENYDNSGTII
ncbi:MAG: ATP-binding protein [Candidatus Bruticola sp.]